MNLPVLGGLDGTGLESVDSAVVVSTNVGRFVDILLAIVQFLHVICSQMSEKRDKNDETW